MRTDFRLPFSVRARLIWLIALAFHAPALSQSESQIRQEQAQQTQQLKDLQAEVGALRTRVAELERLVAELRTRTEDTSQNTASADAPKQPKVPTTPTPQTPATKADDPTQTPMQSPTALLATLRANFNRDLMKDPSFVLGVNSPDERAQKEADSVLSSWIARMNRLYRKPISWPIAILDEQEQPNGDVLYTIQIKRPDGQPEGEPILQLIPERIARRVSGWQSQPNLAQLILKGLLEPKLTIIPIKNDSQAINTEIAFDSGHIDVNQWVRFNYRVKVTSIMPIFVESVPQPNTEEGQSGS